MCYCEGTTPLAVQLKVRATAYRNSSGKASTLVGTFPRIEPRKRWVLLLSKTPKTGVVGHSSLSERHESSNEHGTAQESKGMDGCPLSAFPCPLRYTPSRGHAAFLSRPTTRERQKLLDFLSKRSVTTGVSLGYCSSMSRRGQIVITTASAKPMPLASANQPRRPVRPESNS